MFFNYQNKEKYVDTGENILDKGYKSLEQRVMKLEKELKYQQNKNNNIIFNNDILAEKIRPSITERDDIIQEDNNGHKIKKEKRKKKKTKNIKK